jgi:hypothetical protein
MEVKGQAFLDLQERGTPRAHVPVRASDGEINGPILLIMLGDRAVVGG